MNHNHVHDELSGTSPSFWRSKFRIALIMVGLVILFYLLRDHWNHIGGNWLYLLLFLCPLMHLFGHGGHGGHGHGSIKKPPSDEGKT